MIYEKISRLTRNERNLIQHALNCSQWVGVTFEVRRSENWSHVSSAVKAEVCLLWMWQYYLNFTSSCLIWCHELLITWNSKSNVCNNCKHVIHWHHGTVGLVSSTAIFLSLYRNVQRFCGIIQNLNDPHSVLSVISSQTRLWPQRITSFPLIKAAVKLVTGSIYIYSIESFDWK